MVVLRTVVVLAVVDIAVAVAVAVDTCDIADLCNMMAHDMVDVVVHTKIDRALLVAVEALEQHSPRSYANLYRQTYHVMFQRIHENFEVWVV